MWSSDIYEIMKRWSIQKSKHNAMALKFKKKGRGGG